MFLTIIYRGTIGTGVMSSHIILITISSIIYWINICWIEFSIIVIQSSYSNWYWNHMIQHHLIAIESFRHIYTHLFGLLEKAAYWLRAKAIKTIKLYVKTHPNDLCWILELIDGANYVNTYVWWWTINTYC